MSEREAGRPGWVPIVAIAVVAAVIVAGIVLARSMAGPEHSSEATLSIVSPADGAVVTAGEPFTVQVELRGGELGEHEGHLHIHVDGRVENMPPSTESELTLDEGDHELMVEYVDHTHRPFDPPVTATIELTAE